MSWSGDAVSGEQIMQSENRMKRIQQQIKDAKQSASGLTPQGLCAVCQCSLIAGQQ